MAMRIGILIICRLLYLLTYNSRHSYLKYFRFEHATLELCPRLTFRMLFARIYGCRWLGTELLHLPCVSEDERTGFDTLRWRLHVIHSIVIVIAAQSFHFVLPFVTEFHVDACTFIPFHLQFERYYFDHNKYTGLVDVEGAMPLGVACIANF